MHPRIAMVLGFAVWCSAGAATVQGQTDSLHPWRFVSRVLVTGTNRSSDPGDYHVYTAFPVELALDRALGRGVRVELAVRNESREVDHSQAPANARLGSIEFLPVNLLVQLARSRRHTFRPYLGAGANVTVAWEKSGVLDSMDVSPSFGPAVQLGADLTLNSYLDLNIDFRWNTHRADVEAGGVRLVRLLIDAASLGAGIGVAF